MMLINTTGFISMRKFLIFFFLLVLSGHCFSAMQTEDVTYQDGDVTLQAKLFYDDAYEGKRAGILIMPERWGLNDFAILKAEMLAETGYVALIADMYGDGKNTRKEEEADQWKQALTADPQAWAKRTELALDQLLGQKNVEKNKTAVLGLNLGGVSALKLANASAKIKGVAVVHAPLHEFSDEDVSNISAEVLILQGGSDNVTTLSALSKITDKLTQGDKVWELVVYGGAQQSFTDPYADSYGLENVTFSEDAEKKAWDQILNFYESLFEEELFLY
jgi:dienelactone hydrolase